MFGGRGKDTIGMGAGNDTASGGGEADSFVLAPVFGHDEITDFETGLDVLVMDAALFGDGSRNWTDYVDNSTPHLALVFSEDDSILLTNLKAGTDIAATSCCSDAKRAG